MRVETRGPREDETRDRAAMGEGAVARLIGHHIAYSASPVMHRAAFAALGLPHRYELDDVAAEELPDAIDRLRGAGSLGANVTTPHKVAAAALVDALAPEAERLGAVNTIVARDGQLTGHNTDLPALIEELRELSATSPRHAVVLGSGGAARAVLAALQELAAARVSVVSRAGDQTWTDLPRLLSTADLVINATPIGTSRDESPVPSSLLRPGLAVLDLVYRPSPTRFAGEARAAGARARAGGGVLLRQGAKSFELWLGHPAPFHAMRAALVRELGPDAVD